MSVLRRKGKQVAERNATVREGAGEYIAFLTSMFMNRIGRGLRSPSYTCITEKCGRFCTKGGARAA